MLTGIGGDGSTEDWMGFGALRHYIGGLRSRRLRSRRPRGLRGRFGLRLALGLGFALLLQLLQFPHPTGEGALQAGALRGDAVQQLKLCAEMQAGLPYTGFACGCARKQSLGHGHLFQVIPFGVSLRLPFGFEIVPELLIVGGVLVVEHEAACAQTPGEGVETHGGLAFRTRRTGGMLGILPVSLVLLVGN